MFYDLEDIPGFMEAITTWLHDDGVFIVQMTDLHSMMKVNAFDNIVHEHLEYWSLKSLSLLLKRYGIEVFNVSENDVNGGSIRAYCSFNGKNRVDGSVNEYLEKELPWITDGWRSFEINMNRTIAAIKAFLITARHCGKRVCAIGASTKGNTLLQLLEANPSLISSIGEVSSNKFGLFTAGSEIPILSETEVLSLSPDYLIVLPWHFARGFEKKLEGRDLVIPMPIPRLNQAILW
jgi:NDP-4-keto-2,6-dideoxyhexose 3-C-methyltransferase